MRVPKRWTHTPVMASVLILMVWVGAYVQGMLRSTLGHLETLVEPELERQLGRDVHVGRAYVSGVGRIVLEDLTIPEDPKAGSGALLHVRRALLDYGLAQVLMHRDKPVLAVSSLRIEDPELHLARRPSGEWNFADLVRPSGRPPVWKDFRGQLTIAGGRVTVDDRGDSRRGRRQADLRDVSFSLDAGGAPNVRMQASAGAGDLLRRVALAGTYDLGRHDLDLRADFEGADLPMLQRYSGVAVALPARTGKAGGSVRITVKAGGAPHVEGDVRSDRVVMAPAMLRQPLVAEPLRVGIKGTTLTLDAQGRAGSVPVSLSGTMLLRNRHALLDLDLRVPRAFEADVRRVVRHWPTLPGVTWESPAEARAHLSGPSTDWLLSVDGRLPQVNARGFRLTDLRTTVEYRHAPRLALVRSAQAQVAGGTIRATGRVDAKSLPSRVLFTGAAENVDLALVPLMAKTPKQGTGRVTFTAGGLVNDVSATLTASGSGIRLGPARFRQAAAEIVLPWKGNPSVRARATGIEPAEKGGVLPAVERGEASLRVLPDRVQVVSGTVLVAGETIGVSGTATAAGALDLRVSAKGADAGKLSLLVGLSDVRGRGDATARVTGSMAQPRVAGHLAIRDGRVRQLSFGGIQADFALESTSRGTAQLSVSNARVAGLPVAIPAASGRAELDGDTVRLSGVRVALPRGSLTAQGSATRDGKLDLGIQAAGVDLAMLAKASGMAGSAGASLNGPAAFDGRISGRVDAPRLAGRFAVGEGSIRGLHFTNLRGRVEASSAGVVARDVVLRRGDETATLVGSVEAGGGRPLVVNGRVQALSFDVGAAARALGLPLSVSGKARADLQVKGAYPNLSVAGGFSVQDAVLAGVPVARVSGRLSGPEGILKGGSAIHLDQVTLEEGGARLVASGTLEPGGRLSLDFQGSQVPLERLGRFTQPYAALAGRADMTGSVKGSLKDPQVSLSVRASSMQANGQELGAVSGDLAYAAGSLQVAHLAAVRGATAYQVDQLAYRPGDGSLTLEGSARGADLAGLEALLRSVKLPETAAGRALMKQIASIPSPLRGRADATVSLSGRLPQLTGHATFALGQATVGKLAMARLAGSATWSPQGIEVRDGIVSAGGVDLAGNFKWGPGDRLSTEVQLKDTRVEALRALALNAAALSPAKPGRPGPAAAIRAAIAGLPSPFTGVVTADASLQGSLKALDGYARFQLAGAQVGEASFSGAGATLRWDRGSIAADDLAIQAEGVDVHGSFRRSTGGDLALQLSLGDTEIGAARDLAQAVTSAVRATQGGRLIPASVPAILADLPTPLAGTVSGTFSLTGKPGALQGSLSARGTNLRLAQSELAAITAEGSWSPAGWSFPTLSLARKDCTLSGSLAMASDRLSGSLSTENASLAELRATLASATFLRRFSGAKALLARVDALPRPLSGRVTGSVQVTGTLERPEARITFAGSDLVVGSYKLAGLEADGEVLGSVATIRNLEARTNGGRLSVRGRVEADGPVDLAVTGTDFSLGALGPLLGGRKIEGRLDLAATVRGTMLQPVAEAQIVLRDADVSGMRFGRIQADGVRLADGRMDLGRVELQQGSLSGSLSGSIPFRWDPIEVPTDEPIQLAFVLPEVDLSKVALAKSDGKSPLDMAGAPGVRPLLDIVESASGRAGADLVVTGTLREPNMNGKVEVHEGQVKLAGLDNTFKGIEAVLRLEGPWVIVDQFTARSDRGGVITASGRAGIRSNGDQSLDVRLHADGVQVGLQNAAGMRGLTFKGTTGGDLVLSGRLAQPVLRGKLQVSKAQMNVPSEITPRLQRPPQTLFDPALDIEVQVAGGSSVRRGSALSAAVSAGLGVRGKLSSPVVGGRAVVERGDLRYAGISFRLQQGGTVSFSYDTVTSLTARLDLTALTRIRALSPSSGDRRSYAVTMHLTGAVPNINVAVTSDPPDLPQYRLLAILSRTDQFEALSKGEDLQSILRGQVADVLTGTMLPQVFEPIEEGLAQALGLDEVHFDYGFDRPLSVDARKEVLPRVYVGYSRGSGEGQFTDSTQEWSVTYRIAQSLHVGWRRDMAGKKDRLVLEGSFKF